MTGCTNQDIVDVAIVGAGPAGLGAGLYTARAGLKTIVFGDPYQSQLAKAGVVENYLTYERLQGVELVEKMVEHATHWGADLRDQEIRQIVHDGKVFQLQTEQAEAVCAYTVILAMGTKYRKLGAEGEEEFYTRGVSYCTLCDGPLYRGKPVAIVGFGNEAASAALRMSTIADSVALIATKPRLGAEEVLLDRLNEAENLKLYQNARVEQIVGDKIGVTAVEFSHEGRTLSSPVNAVFIEVGTLPASAIAADLGVELEGQFIKVNQFQATNVPGVFAAGDITGNGARQAAVAVGDGTKAAIAVIDHIKSLGLSAEKSKLLSIQWGEVSHKGKKAPAKTVAQKTKHNELLAYVQADSGFERAFQSYHPNEQILAKIREIMPEGKVITVSATWCPDCRRNVPRLARIAEHLPGWSFEIYPDSDENSARFGVRAIPAFIVYDKNGRELGRIIENPLLGSMEADLLDIVSGGRNASR